MQRPKSIKKNKYTRVGQVLKGKDGGSYITLGNDRNKDPKYNYSVELTVRNSAGEVVAKQTDGYLSVFDPRDGQNADNVPDFVLFDISMKEAL